MKKIIALLVLLVAATSTSYTQGKGKYYRVLGYIEDKGYTVSKNEYADLKKDEYANLTKEYYKGNSYLLVAFSDNDGVDMDLYLYDDDGSLHSKDTDSDDMAVITFEPLRTRELRAKYKCTGASSSYTSYKCRLVIAYK